MGGIFMSLKDQKTYELCQGFFCGKLTIVELSLLINKSYRQTQRILKKIESQGMKGVLHGNCFKTPINKTSSQVEEDIRKLLKEDYYDFNLTHFREMLEEKEGIFIGKNVIHRIAKKHSLVKKARRRTNKKIHKPRPRLPSEGMLVQFDGSVHNWFADIICDLIGGIDDATGKILALEFFYGETSLHCMKVMKDITLNHGLPDAYYLDGAGYFGKIDRDTETQIGRAFDVLGVKTLIAGSSQAKGRIERLWGTLQDRLIAELRFYQITTIEDANKFLKEDFIPRFNEQFSVPARDQQTHFKKCNAQNLDMIFCKKNSRKISMANSFSFEGQTYVLQGDMNYKFRTININTHIDGEITYDICGRKIEVMLQERNTKNTDLFFPKAA